MTNVWIYLGSLAAFLAIDAVWLTTVMRPLFERHVGALLRPEIQLGAAAGFYLIYIVGIMYFCTLPALREGGLGLAALNGAILGFLAYGTYEFTNMTTLKGWTWSMVISDTAWGMALTATTAVVGYLIGRALA
ncbi:MAG: DUF2177 family protein [Pseudomonadota bacterium]